VDIINEINILKASMGCPYIVEYVGCYMKNDMLMLLWNIVAALWKM